MAINPLLLVAGLLGAGLALKKLSASYSGDESGRGKYPGLGKRFPKKKKWDPLCYKYPAGAWAPGEGYLEGYPKDSPGYTDEESARVVEMAKQAVAEAPAWKTLDEANEIAFSLTKEIVSTLCPGRILPGDPSKVESHLRKSIPLRYLWTTVNNLVFQGITGASAGP